MQQNTIVEFDDLTTTKKKSYGYECQCNMGLWGVIAPSKEEAIKEGYSLFIQYYSDGEYD